MFNNKKDRKIVELTIELNLDAISKWIKEKGEIEDIKKFTKDWGLNVTKLSYLIDVLPNGQSGDMYYHRNKGIISGNVGGIDFLGNAPVSMQNFCKRSGIELIEWGRWREYLSLSVNKKLILIVPIEEFGILQLGGKLSSERKTLGREITTVKVPFSFDDQGKPKEFMEIERSTNNDKAIGFGNGLGWISGSTLNYEVEY